MRRRTGLVAAVIVAAFVVIVIVAALMFDDDAEREVELETGAATTSTGPASGDGERRAAGDDTDDPAGTDLAPRPLVIDQIPGDPPAVTASALDDMTDPSFPEPLVDPADILSGGPPPDGIPSIDRPTFHDVADVDWLDGDEPVVVLDLDGDVRAYPVQILTWHELVNDTFGDLPVTVSCCPLCNSAIAYVREVDGRVLDFGTSGRLHRSSLVMYDRQTESLWSHFTATAIIGELTGTELETLPMATVSWDDFRTAHPDGLVLSRDTGNPRDYGRNPYPGYDDVDNPPFLFEGEVDGRLAAQTRVVAVRGETDTVAIVQEDLYEERVVELTVDGRALVALLEPGTASALDARDVADGRDIGAVGVFVPEAGGRSLTFEALDGGGFTDTETGTTWDILGRATAGPLEGETLERVEHLDTFWFAIAAFAPDTVIATG